MGLSGAALLALVLTIGGNTTVTDPEVAAQPSPRSTPARASAPHAAPDPDWVFYSTDRTRYTSPWFRRGHRIMIGFGCTPAPYYSPDPRCADDHGFHHGIDVAMPCGTPLFARTRGWVVSHDSLGSAYGENPLRIRNYTQGWDVVIGHTRRVFVAPGDRVRPGDRLARASDSAAPDGCHLHFEKRSLGGGLDSAAPPRTLLRLRPVTRS